MVQLRKMICIRASLQGCRWLWPVTAANAGMIGGLCDTPEGVP
jgi:hypothetical protein